MYFSTNLQIPSGISYINNLAALTYHDNEDNERMSRVLITDPLCLYQPDSYRWFVHDLADKIRVMYFKARKCIPRADKHVAVRITQLINHMRCSSRQRMVKFSN